MNINMRSSTRKLVVSAVTAALYVLFGLVSNALGLAWGPVQLRLSEALCVLPCILPGSALGITLGCVIFNLLSPYGPVDLICGSLATLVAALATAKIKKPALAWLPPVLCNALVIGAMLAWYETGFSAGFWRLFGLNALWVGLGEALSCCLLGAFLLRLVPRLPLLRDMIKGDPS